MFTREFFVPLDHQKFVFPHKTNPLKPMLSYDRSWRTACKNAGISAVPYDLRRSFITRCAAQNLPLVYVAKILDTSVKLIESTYAKSQKEVMENLVK